MGKDELARTGDCYEAAFNTIHRSVEDEDDQRELTLVHGEVEGQQKLAGVRHGHAWVEWTEPVEIPEGSDIPEHVYKELAVMVEDNSSGRHIVLPAKLYYGIGRIDNTHRYTWEEARAKVLEHGTYGPWDLKTSTGL